MTGYDGWSMSNNARSAYSKGEKPWSKWTKREIYAEASEELTEEELLNFRANTLKIKAEELKNLVLYRSSWHHTSKFYNETNFYSLDVEEVKNLTSGAPQDLRGKILKQDEKKRLKEEEREASLEAYRLEQERLRKEAEEAKAIKLVTEYPSFKAIAKSWKESNSWRGFSKVANVKARNSFEELTGFTFDSVSAEAFANFRKYEGEEFLKELFFKLNK